MSKIVAFRNKSAFKNIEGDTYVIPGEDSYNPVDIQSARKGDWNDMNPYDNEAEYISPRTVEDVNIERIKHRKVGEESILAAVA